MQFPMWLMLFSLCSLLPVNAFAWESRHVEEDAVIIQKPEMEQAFYGTLSGETQVYRFMQEDAWTLDLNILVPASTNPKGKFDVIVVNESAGAVASVLESGAAPWEAYYDLNSAEHYFRGPVLHQELPPGAYRIVVSNADNTGHYTLLIGATNEFSIREMAKNTSLLPRLKKEFFESPRISLVASPLQSIYALLMLMCGVIVAVYMRKFAPSVLFFRKPQPVQYKIKNIDLAGRTVRFAIGLTLLVVAVCTTWSAALFVAAGFCFYEAFASWCALFGILGRTSCPIEGV